MSATRTVGAGTVSVVIPCYNQGRFLAEALASVRAQNRDLEVIAVDDGSTDETRAVLTGYPEVQVLACRRVGVSAARNAGLAASRGEQVLFLDADDRLLPGAIEAHLEVLRAHPECAFVAGHFRRIDGDGRPLPPPPPPAIGEPVYELLLRGNPIHTATVLYRREPLVAAGGFDPRLRVCEDWALYLALARVHEARLHDREVSEYRQHRAQTTAQGIDLLLRSGIELLRRQRPLLRSEREHAAWRAGQHFWREHYGSRLFRELRIALAGGRLSPAAHCASVLARYAPAYFAERVVRGTWRRLRPGGHGNPPPAADSAGA